MLNIRRLITATFLIGLIMLNPVSAMDLENHETRKPHLEVIPIRCIADEKQQAAMSKLVYNFWALKEISSNYFGENALPLEIRTIIGDFAFQYTEFYFSFPTINDLKTASEKLSLINGVILDKETGKIETEIYKNGITFHCTYNNNEKNYPNLISLEDFKLSAIIFSHGLPTIPRTKNDLDKAKMSYSQKSALISNNEMNEPYKTVCYSNFGAVFCKYIHNTSDLISIDISASFFNKNKETMKNPLKYYSIEMIKTENAKGDLTTNYAANLCIPMLFSKYQQNPNGPEVDLHPDDVYFSYRRK